MEHIGLILDNQYELISQLSTGGTSVVYLARDLQLSTIWAVKALNKRNNIQSYDRQMEEARFLAKLNFPMIPRIVKYIETDEMMYIVMDYIQGMPLNQYLEINGQQNEKQVVSWLLQICDVLYYLHQQGFVYCDLKPQNLILNNEQIRLIDFGSVLSKGDYESKRSGTHGFSAPEFYNRRIPIDERMDVFSLGVTAFTLLTKKKYSLGVLKKYGVSDIGEGMAYIIDKATKDYTQRYKSIDEMADDLKHLDHFTTNYLHKMQRRVGVFLCCLLLCIASFIVGTLAYFRLSDTTTAEYDALYNQGLQYEQNGDAERASDAYLQAIVLKDDDIEIYHHLWDMVAPKGPESDYAKQMKNALDLFRLNCKPEVLQSDPVFLLAIAKEAIAIGDGAYIEYATRILNIIKKDKAVNGTEVQALINVMEMSKASPNIEMIKKGVDQLLEVAQTLSDEQKLENYYLILIAYQNFNSELEITDGDYGRVVNQVVSIVDANKENQSFESTKIIPLYRTITAYYASQGITKKSETALNEAVNWISKLEASGAGISYDELMRFGDVYYMLGQVKHQVSDYERAKGYYSRALNEASDVLLSYIALTQVSIEEESLAGQMDYPESKKHWQQVEALIKERDNVSVTALNQYDALRLQLQAVGAM
ncbi:MAG: serine/threonine-protein kinase [Eubacterium sp.]